MYRNPRENPPLSSGGHASVLVRTRPCPREGAPLSSGGANLKAPKNVLRGLKKRIILLLDCKFCLMQRLRSQKTRTFPLIPHLSSSHPLTVL